MTDITTLSDKDLIELAAEAAGHIIDDWEQGTPFVIEEIGDLHSTYPWNPLLFCQDVFRLMCKLHMNIELYKGGLVVVARHYDISGKESVLIAGSDCDPTVDINTRYARAITRCAALVALERRKQNG